MIEMSCPRCGAGGRIRRDQISARLVCKKCLQVFHLTPSGQAVMGEPPPPKDQPKTRAKVKSGEPRESAGLSLDLSSLTGLRQALSKVRLPDPKILAALVVVSLIGGLVYWLLSRESLQTRAERLVEGVVTGNIGAVMEISSPGTEPEAMAWFNDLYQEYLDLKRKLGGMDPGVQIQTNDESAGSSGQAVVVFTREGAHLSGEVLVQVDAPPAASPNEKQSIELQLFFVKDPWGDWRFDAKQTAEFATQKH